MPYDIFCESSCDLPGELLDELNVKLIPLNVIIDGDTISNENLPMEEFYRLLRNGKDISTCAANINDYYEHFKPSLEAGLDILLMGFSSGLSSSVSNAGNSAQMLREEFPERKIIIVDTLAASGGHGMLVDIAAKKRGQGWSIEDTAEYIEDIKLKLCHFFTVASLFHLKKGGRVSAAAAVLGTIAGIKPILYMDENGKILLHSKSRGRKASIKDMIAMFDKHVVNPETQEIFISNCDCPQDAQYLADILSPRVKKVTVTNIGPVIGSHSGPETLALFFIGDSKI